MTGRRDHVVSGLIKKRRELARLVETLQEQLDQHRADLAHIDGTLRLLGHNLDPETLRPKARYQHLPHFGRNELSRLLLATLRTAADEPIGIDEIARRVAAAKGFDAGDATQRAAIRQRLRAILTRLRNQGEIEGLGTGRGSKWKLAGALAGLAFRARIDAGRREVGVPTGRRGWLPTAHLWAS